jgi:hypothetical protein
MGAEGEKRAAPDKRAEIQAYNNIIRSMIEHENSLINNRLNWFILLEGLLLAGLSGLAETFRTLAVVLAIVGIVVSVSFAIEIAVAGMAIGNLLSLWSGRLETEGVRWQEFPPVIGVPLQKRSVALALGRYLSPTRFLPPAFVVAWCAVLYYLLR